MSYGATTVEKLRNISDNYHEFTDALSAEDIQRTICDLLFTKYVEKKSPDQICDELLEKLVPDGSIAKLELSEFEVMEGFKEDVKIPVNPHTGKPHILLFDLENEKCKDTQAYKYIEETSKVGPCALYGTSGAGKTRSVLEFLSKNYGFYFLARCSTAEEDFGSRDMSELLVMADSDPAINQGGAEHFLMNKYMRLVLFVRGKVFCRILEVKGTLSPYEWLLAQLYPRLIWSEGDIFHRLVLEMSNAGLGQTELLIQRRFFHLFMRTSYRFHLFVDEAQAMINMSSGKFKSLSFRSWPRCMYYAVVNSLKSVVLGYRIHFPVFTGTGVRSDILEGDMPGSCAAKVQMISYKPVFSDFDVLDEEKVKNYLSRFVALDDQNDTEMSHVCKWLKGRPQWSATFVQFWMTGCLTTETPKHIVQAIETYVQALTRASSLRSRRGGQRSDSVAEASAFSIFERSLDTTDLCSNILSSILEYALTGSPVVLCSSDTVNGTYAVDNGFCVLVRDKYRMMVTLGEPLMVEAGLQFIGESKIGNDQLFRNRSSDSAMGNDFERWMLPVLQSLSAGKLKTILQTFRTGQTSQHLSWSGSWFPRRSAYGVLARKSSTLQETVSWMEASVSYEVVPGSVPPFCFPDVNMGPDLLYFLFSDPYNVRSEFKLCIWQMKLTQNVNVSDAWTKTLPEVFYNGVRNEESNWPTVYSKIFGSEPGRGEEPNKNRKRSVLRGLAVPLLSLKRSKGATDEESQSIQGVEDPIVWVDRDNCDELLGEYAAEFLHSLKASN